jgi:predicted MFS family arabinose efflux permease
MTRIISPAPAPWLLQLRNRLAPIALQCASHDDYGAITGEELHASRVRITRDESTRVRIARDESTRGRIARDEPTRIELHDMKRDGWLLVIGVAAAQVVSWGSIYYSFSLFVVPMERDLGWSRAHLNAALSLGLLTAAFSAYPIGACIDRYGGRGVMTAGSALAVVLLAAWARTDSLFWLYAIWAGLGIALAATLYEPAFAVMTRRFPDDYRTRITAVTLIGGFASTVFIPLTQLFITLLGWRHALMALALCNLAICVPVHALLLRDGQRPGAAPAMTRAESDDAMQRALRHPVFWGLAISFTAYYAAFSAMTFHVIPLLIERGMAMPLIVGAIAVIGPAQVAGRVVLFALHGRLTTSVAGTIAMIAFPLSILIVIAFPASSGALFAFALLYGGANGIITIVRGTAVPELLWREGYGAINGALTVPGNIAKALAPFGAAALWSAAGGYDAVLWAIFGSGAVAALLFVRTARYARRARRRSGG